MISANQGPGLLIGWLKHALGPHGRWNCPDTAMPNITSGISDLYEEIYRFVRRHWNWPNWRHVWLRCHAETPICRKCHTRRWRDERIVQHLCTAQLPDCTCAQSTYVHRQSNTCTQTCNIPDIGSMHTSSCQLIVTVLMKFPLLPKSFVKDLVLTLIMQKIIKKTLKGAF